MGLESVTYIDDLVATNPVRSTDPARFSADHIQNLKKAIKNTLPNVSGAVSATHTELSYLQGVTSAIQTQIDAKLASATYTAADVMAKVQTADGPGSGLNADQLDGNEGSYYTGYAEGTSVQSLNGYQTLPSGITIQWGSHSCVNTGYSAVTFPVGFSTLACSVTATVIDDDSTLRAASIQASSIDTAGFSACVKNNSGYVAATVRWIAMGY